MKVANRAGFTLVEILIALVILTVGVTGWVMSQNTNVKSRDLSGTLATAQELTRSTIENLISTAQERNRSEGGLANQETFVFPLVTYTVSSTLNATTLNSEGKPVWLITAITSFDRYGSYNTTLERMVVGH
jgi:prepilin-type N-terminal cleavage/methylation domain-containing protein